MYAQRRTVTDADGTWVETLSEAGMVTSRQLKTPSAAWKQRNAESGMVGRSPSAPPNPVVPNITADEKAAIGWAASKKNQETSDAEDTTVQTIISDLQQVKTDIKAAPSGNITLTKAQMLKIVRAALWHIKGDKSA